MPYIETSNFVSQPVEHSRTCCDLMEPTAARCREDEIDEPVPADYSNQLELLIGWEVRELSRLNDGTYQTLPVKVIRELAKHGVELNPAHYLHVASHVKELMANADKSKIAYTENAVKGAVDRQTVVKFGRYLKKYHPALIDHSIQAVVRVLQGELNVQSDNGIKLHFATDRDTISKIFETRMCARGNDDFASCMYGKFADWDIRPYWVYADSPDVKLAYVMSDERIVARTVVSEINKTWIRLYAVEERWSDVLQTMVESAGYQEQGNLTGCRLTLLREERSEKLIAPYIDGKIQSGEIIDGWLKVCRNGSLELNETNGYADGEEEDERVRCTECREWIDGDDSNTNYHGSIYCHSCYDDLYSRCEDCEEETLSDEMYCVVSRRGYEQSVCDSCRNNNYTEATNERGHSNWYHNDNVVEACDGEWYTTYAAQDMFCCECCSQSHVDGCDCDCRTVDDESENESEEQTAEESVQTEQTEEQTI